MTILYSAVDVSNSINVAIGAVQFEVAADLTFTHSTQHTPIVSAMSIRNDQTVTSVGAGDSVYRALESFCFMTRKIRRKLKIPI